ncbi:hypothetical protein SE17_31040 [Kouleothrix aurantiaca]|uniref:Uncharacterized protein n=1 Tax=Kouleothrix aurantiaca TaxID=186479 RepID=A0A0P9DAW1_9CHLR|nr:hypothetical protein SE17_31040 [Kouleothrix aurantiaca]
MTTIAELDKKIAEFEATLSQPLPEVVLDSLRTKIAELREERARLTHAGVQNTVNNSGTIHGSVMGANYGTTNNNYYGTAPSTPARPPTREEEIAEQQELLARHRSTLSAHLRRLAIVGSAFAPPEVFFGIREARGGIARARAALEGYGVAIEAHPDDVER